MPRCKGCTAAEDMGLVDEYYIFGPGCVDEDYDVYGGDCIAMHRDQDKEEKVGGDKE